MKSIKTLVPIQLVILMAGAMALLLLAGCDSRHPDVGVPVAHAAPGDVDKGCTKCHDKPIVATCSTCHTSPPVQIRGIVFPHHDVTSGKPITNCQMCHTSSDGDARYVKVVKSSMAFCKQCHPFTHSG